MGAGESCNRPCCRGTQTATRHEGGGEGAGQRERRGPGAFFWAFVALMAFVVASNAAQGSLLAAGTFSAMGLSVVFQRTGLTERSAAWGRAYNALVVAFCPLAVLYLLRNAGVI